LSVLPSEILYELLLRLPVKSLLNMRCISKSWFALISCPIFIKTHLKFSTQNQDFRCLFRAFMRIASLLTLALLMQLCIKKNLPIYLYLFNLIFLAMASWVGACEGLFCFFNQFWVLFLWNPTIRKSKKLPFSGLDPHCGQSSSCGFGYIECQDGYKVVDIRGNSHGDVFLNVFKIYSLRSNSWKRIQDYP
ncbi:f-box protein cpr30, partial [Nicotiana attenuata]